MKLENLIEGLSIIQLAGEVERKDIVSICYDSRKAVKNSLFVAIKGFNTDGHKYVMEAIARGVSVIVIEDDSNISNDYLVHQNVTKILVHNSRKALAILSKNFYKNPSNNIKVIGITGTNGKTSTTFIVKSILEAAGFKVGLIGTIKNLIGSEELSADMTTPESLELNQILQEMVENRCEYCVMEVSSHALELDRVYGINFCAAVFTNLTQDHLDFHSTFENYFLAKKKLFDSLDEKAIAITNLDDQYGRRIIENTKARVITYGKNSESSYSFDNANYSFEGIQYDVNHREKKFRVRTNLIGKFNIYNSLAAIALCSELGIKNEVIEKTLLNLPLIEGRFQIIGNYPIKVIVDYAHTPDALENVLNTIRDVLSVSRSTGKVITITGAGGDRDRTKRPLMGHAVQKHSDFVILTSDNPRTEDPNQIISDILSGMQKNDKILIELDREKAIKRAIEFADLGDVILIAGKGHESYQVIGNQKVPFSDIEVSKKYLIQRFGK